MHRKDMLLIRVVYLPLSVVPAQQYDSVSAFDGCMTLLALPRALQLLLLLIACVSSSSSSGFECHLVLAASSCDHMSHTTS
jgi:hypothetical protein